MDTETTAGCLSVFDRVFCRAGSMTTVLSAEGFDWHLRPITVRSPKPVLALPLRNDQGSRRHFVDACPATSGDPSVHREVRRSRGLEVDCQRLGAEWTLRFLLPKVLQSRVGPIHAGNLICLSLREAMRCGNLGHSAQFPQPLRQSVYHAAFPLSLRGVTRNVQCPACHSRTTRAVGAYVMPAKQAHRVSYLLGLISLAA